MTTYAGTGSRRFYGEKVPAIDASFRYPSGVTIDLSGDLIITDFGNHHVRKVTASTRIITTIVGVCNERGYSGDGGLAKAAFLKDPLQSAFDAQCGRTGYTGPTGRTGPWHDPSDPSAYSTYTSLA